MLFKPFKQIGTIICFLKTKPASQMGLKTPLRILIYLHCSTNRFLPSFKDYLTCTMSEAGILSTTPLCNFFASIQVFLLCSEPGQTHLVPLQTGCTFRRADEHSKQVCGLGGSPRLPKAQPPTALPERALPSPLSHAATFSRLLL